MKTFFIIGIITLTFVCGCRTQHETNQSSTGQEQEGPEALKAERKGDFVTQFKGQMLFPGRRDANVAYDLNPGFERYFVHVAQEYNSETPYGLIVFTDAADEITELPEGWGEVLDRRKYLFVAAQNAGNDQDINRRLGLAVLGALEMMKHYRIDPNRVYAAGFSGGARMSGLLGFYQADLFHGTIQNCGADFYRPVQAVEATTQFDTAGLRYGLLSATPDEIAAARNVRFALITGSKDFRRGNIVDIFNGGFARDGFHAKLLDVPGMAHDTADAQTLSTALDFVEAPR